MKKKDYEEYLSIVSPILEHEEFIKRKTFKHHGDITVYDHCLNVSKCSYIMAKKLRCDYKKAAIGGLLHDFYTNPWQDSKEKKPFFKMHGFVHASEAAENAKKSFPQFVDKKVENIIRRHMFPLNITPPRYKEGWIVTIADKYVSMEVFKKPKDLLKYVGIKSKKR